MLSAAAVVFQRAVFRHREFDEIFECMDAGAKAACLATDASSVIEEATPILTRKPYQRCHVWLHGPTLAIVGLHFVNQAVSMFFMPFLTFYGNLQTAHLLVLIRFGSELLGRLAAHVCGLSRFGCMDGSGLAFLVALTASRVAILVILTFDLFGGVHVPHGYMLEGLTGAFYFTFAWSNSELMAALIDVSSRMRSGNEECHKRGALMPGMILIGFGAQLIGLCAAWAMLRRHVSGSDSFFSTGIAARSCVYFDAFVW